MSDNSFIHHVVLFCSEVSLVHDGGDDRERVPLPDDDDHGSADRVL